MLDVLSCKIPTETHMGLITWCAKHIRYVVTERDGVSTCVVRLLGIAAGVVATWRFVYMQQPPDFTGFGTAISTIGGVIALKNWTERD